MVAQDFFGVRTPMPWIDNWQQAMRGNACDGIGISRDRLALPSIGLSRDTLCHHATKDLLDRIKRERNTATPPVLSAPEPALLATADFPLGWNTVFTMIACFTIYSALYVRLTKGRKALRNNTRIVAQKGRSIGKLTICLSGPQTLQDARVHCQRRNRPR